MPTEYEVVLDALGNCSGLKIAEALSNNKIMLIPWGFELGIYKKNTI